MDTDFRPVKGPAGSLRKALDERGYAKIPTPAKKDFKTPEEAAAEDDVLEKVDMSEAANTPVAPKSGGTGGSFWDRFRPGWPPGKKEWAYIAAVVLLIAAAAHFILARDSGRPVANAPAKVKKIPPKAKTVASNLTGLQVDPSINQKPVTAIMIENSLDARPQSGLSDAGVVFEAIAEGGITRFLALFQDNSPGDVGPIRSARPYYLQWEMAFDAPYAHVGGSPEALSDIKAWGVRDLDQFFNSQAYHRSASRPAPHNVYSSIDALNQLETGKGFTTSTYTGFARKPAVLVKKKTVKTATQPAPNAATTIDFALSGPLYNVHYDYDAASGTYKRSEGGAPHIDANGNKQITPKVVIGLVTQYGIQSDGKHSDYQVIGSGPVYVFQDGVVTTGTWSKASEKDQLKFTDSSGHDILLEPGQTWVSALSDASKARYTP
jgi:hypothetical protein